MHEHNVTQPCFIIAYKGDYEYDFYSSAPFSPVYDVDFQFRNNSNFSLPWFGTEWLVKVVVLKSLRFRPYL